MATITIRESFRGLRKRDAVLDAVMRLPMSGRRRAKMKTVCDVCGRHIEDEYFYGGFETGHANVLLHESCTPEAMRTHTLTGEPLVSEVKEQK